jgi:hypothetical protein
MPFAIGDLQVMSLILCHFDVEVILPFIVSELLGIKDVREFCFLLCHDFRFVSAKLDEGL